MTFQGRRFASREFPAPADRLPRFSSCSRCLIDLGTAFVVLTEGQSGPPQHHRMLLFRLETMDRNSIEFEDETQLSKNECAALLEEQLDTHTECDIVKVRFPFFDLENLQNNSVMYKFRPCVALYGNSASSVYLPIYNNGKPERYDWELALSEDLSPADSAPVSVVVDVSKICGGLPETYDDPDQECHGMNTSAPWFVDPAKKRHPITPVQPGALRGKIVALLMKLLVDNNNQHHGTRYWNYGGL